MLYRVSHPEKSDLSYNFKLGNKYYRKEIFRAVGVDEERPGGNWFTGYHRHGDVWFIFCNVGVAGRTGHDYRNEWIEDELHWFGKTGSRLHQPAIQSLLDSKTKVHVFYRSAERDPFTYAGLAIPARTEDTQPVKVIWRFKENAV